MQYDHLTPSEAIEIQQSLRNKIVIQHLNKEIKLIGGADISFNIYSEIVYAGIIILSYPDLKEITSATVVAKTTFPYIPGLLAFREVPALVEAWNKLSIKPDVLMLDGHGIAHPRRLGIATHFGILQNVPTIGCGKSRLTGTFQEPDMAVFSQSELYHKQEKIGYVLRSKKNCNPLFVSPGQLVSFEQSLELVKGCLKGYRLPETTRKAHLLVNKVRIEHTLTI
jgi:deoxyribonuclease V